MAFGGWLFYFSRMDLPVLQIQVRMTCASNDLNTLILLKIDSTHIPCVLWAGLMNDLVFSPVHEDLLSFYCMLESDSGVKNTKMTRI